MTGKVYLCALVKVEGYHTNEYIKLDSDGKGRWKVPSWKGQRLIVILSKMNSLPPQNFALLGGVSFIMKFLLLIFYYPGIELKVCTELPRYCNFPNVFFLIFNTAAPTSQPEIPFGSLLSTTT